MLHLIASKILMFPCPCHLWSSVSFPFSPPPPPQQNNSQPSSEKLYFLIGLKIFKLPTLWGVHPTLGNTAIAVWNKAVFITVQSILGTLKTDKMCNFCKKIIFVFEMSFSMLSDTSFKIQMSYDVSWSYLSIKEKKCPSYRANASFLVPYVRFLRPRDWGNLPRLVTTACGVMMMMMRNSSIYVAW